MKKSFLAIIVAALFSFSVAAQTYNDATLARVRTQDAASRDAEGKLVTLSAAEHAYRADVYMSNRAFAEARAHWQKILDNYATDSTVMPKTLFGVARSYMWERDYDKAVFFFDKVIRDYIATKEGREGLAFKSASLVRLGRNAEAAQSYQMYVTMFPTGERIETSYLNLIDALRETKRYDDANNWIEKARVRFSGLPAETNVLFARMRMEFYRGRYAESLAAADVLRSRANFRYSMTSLDEVSYLRALTLEKLNRNQEAIAQYAAINDTPTSYYGGLATDKLVKLNPPVYTSRVQRTASVAPSLAANYPAPFRAELLRYAKPRGVDPRFVLAVMKQESTFRPAAKSPSAARGLLQLVMDTALKYNKQAGFPAITDDDLYRPDVNIAIGSLYIAELKKQFDGLYEAIAASYNGGEDNSARWLARSKPRDAAVFTSEVGFAESKDYVFKVMSNYRVYRELYDENLNRR